MTASAFRARSDDSAPADVAARVRVQLEGGRVFVYITRRQSRCFALSLAEAEHLWRELAALGSQGGGQ